MTILRVRKVSGVRPPGGMRGPRGGGLKIKSIDIVWKFRALSDDIWNNGHTGSDKGCSLSLNSHI